MDGKNQSNPMQEGGYRNPNKFRITFNLQFMQREKRNNEDQKIQPPFQNNLVDWVDDFDDAKIEKPDQEIHLIEEDQPVSHLTQFDYDSSFLSNQEHEKTIEGN